MSAYRVARIGSRDDRPDGGTDGRTKSQNERDDRDTEKIEDIATRSRPSKAPFSVPATPGPLPPLPPQNVLLSLLSSGDSPCAVPPDSFILPSPPVADVEDDDRVNLRGGHLTGSHHGEESHHLEGGVRDDTDAGLLAARRACDVKKRETHRAWRAILFAHPALPARTHRGGGSASAGVGMGLAAGHNLNLSQ